MTYRECYEQGCRTLQAAGIEEAALDARLLLEAVCGTDRNDLLVHGEQPVAPEAEEKYLNWIRQRAEHIPLQQLTGEQGFMGLTFSVNEHVLIPRQDTEILVEEIMRDLHDGIRILDMCTGSGCILLSLLHYSNDCSGVGADVSEDALAVARQNATELNASVELFAGDLMTRMDGQYDVIVSNPPYIPPSVIEGLMPEVRLHEPMLALDGGQDGLEFYRRIAGQAVTRLAPNGRLFLEIGCEQAAAVAEILQKQGYREVQVFQDLAGKDRIVQCIV